MMQWSEDSQEYVPIDWKSAFHVTEERMKEVYDRCVERFNKACAEIERQDDAAKVRHLLTECLGAGTYEIPEE